MKRSPLPVSAVVGLLFAALILLVPNSGLTCTCWTMEDQTLTKEILSPYEHIIEAQVIKLEFFDRENHDNPMAGQNAELDLMVTVRVVRSWTPDSPIVLTFWTQSVSVSCGYPFLAGRVYLIFIREGLEFITKCGRTAKVGESLERIKELNRLLGEPIRYREVSHWQYE